MKEKTKAAVFGAILALVAVLSWSLIHQETKAAEFGGGEKYKVYEIRKPAGPAQIEDELNRLGSQGWKVRATCLNVVILAK